MKIHKEGKKIFYGSLIIALLVLVVGLYFINFGLPLILVSLGCILLLLFLARFFRVPSRTSATQNSAIYSPADGKVVVVEEMEETQFLHQRMLQISIFMSVWDVHINWFPLSGKILLSKHFSGKYLIARVPKSSDLNERHLTLIESPNGDKVLVKQIAGAVARRIINYAREGDLCNHKQEMGFIRFGSRVDVLIPLNYRSLVKQGDRISGMQDVIAVLK